MSDIVAVVIENPEQPIKAILTPATGEVVAVTLSCCSGGGGSGVSGYSGFSGGGGSGGSFLSNEIARVDPSGDDGTGVVGDLQKPFLTVQGAIDAIEAGSFSAPIIDIGNNIYNATTVTTSLYRIRFIGAADELGTFPNATYYAKVCSILVMTNPLANLELWCCEVDTILAANGNLSVLVENAGVVGKDGIAISALEAIVITGNGPLRGFVADAVTSTNNGLITIRNAYVDNIDSGTSDIVASFGTLIRRINTSNNVSLSDSRVQSNFAGGITTYDDLFLKGIGPGGTTGQIQSKASNADFDVQWITPSAATSGFSGYSGAPGIGTVGESGYSGFCGKSGYSGFCGLSGYSGFSAASPGASGYSGFCGQSGYSGFCGTGTSGFSGYSGAGLSGFSGYCGLSGYSGFSAASPGASGYSGYCGLSGYSGFCGLSGYSGFCGLSGYSGFSGDPAQQSGYSGFSGKSGYSGFCGLSGYSGFCGLSGYSGFSGDPAQQSGYSGFSGKSGYSGFCGLSGYSGFCGLSGYSGFCGLSGYSGFCGLSGYSGFCGLSGYSGFCGLSGYSGFCGLSGYSGFSGSGISGYSGFSAASPGASGFSGYSGYCGLSGYSGFCGAGTSGFSGYSGYSGPSLLPNTTQTDTDYTLVLGDSGTMVQMSSSTPHTLTIPLNASVAFSTGTQIVIEQSGLAAVTIVATGGVTLTGATVTTGQYSEIVLIKQSTDTWFSASSAPWPPITQNDYGISYIIPTTGNLLQPNQVTLATSTESITVSGTGALTIYDSLNSHPDRGSFNPGSFILKPGEYIMQYLKLNLNGNQSAVLTGDAMLIVTDFVTPGQLVLTGRGF